MAEASELLNQGRLGHYRNLLPPFTFLLTLLVGSRLPCGDLVEGAPLGFHPHVGVTRRMARETCPAMLMITSSPAPDSVSLSPACVGYEDGKNYRSPKGVALGSFDRKVLGATGYYLLLHPGPFDRITLTGDYSVRLPSIAEPFVPASGANAILTTKPRHHAAVDLNVMLSKAFGITAQYRWGSLPPLFQFVNHSVVVGLVLQLKQAN
jgi:hypothetical protein